jgi:hypothetical protein
MILAKLFLVCIGFALSYSDSKEEIGNLDLRIRSTKLLTSVKPDRLGLGLLGKVAYYTLSDNRPTTPKIFALILGELQSPITSTKD